MRALLFNFFDLFKILNIIASLPRKCKEKMRGRENIEENKAEPPRSSVLCAEAPGEIKGSVCLAYRKFKKVVMTMVFTKSMNRLPTRGTTK